MNLLPLTKQAVQHVNQFEQHVTPDEFNAVLDGIQEHNRNLYGHGFYAIQAKVKLQLICALDLAGFLETVKQFQTEPF